MRQLMFPALAMSFLAVLIPMDVPAKSLPVAGDSAGAYFSGTYNNLFVGLLGKTDSTVLAKIDQTFRQLFYGDDKTERVYYPVGSDMAYIEDINNGDVRTEGMSYGMMICLQLNKKAEFDRLWKWARTHMQFQEGPHRGYFAWHCKTDGTILDPGAASDGEEWFVTSLFLASARWGDGQGVDDYAKEARSILHTMLHKESEPGHRNVTNMFRTDKKLVTFVPDLWGSQFTDPSYQLPHFYELWARWATEDNEFWCAAAKASRGLLQKSADPETGLSPNYSHFDGSPINWRDGGNADFRFDAWRVAMNIAVDCEWFGRRKELVPILDRLLNFFSSQGIDTYGNQYTLKGKRLADDHSTGLVAMNAVAALASTDRSRAEFVRALWNTPVPRGPYRYYDGMLYMLGMLQVSGHFRVYHLNGAPVSACTDN